MNEVVLMLNLPNLAVLKKIAAYRTKLFLQKLSSYFFSDYNLKFQTLWFKRLLYLFLVYQSIYWLYNYNLLFGPDSIIFLRPHSIGAVKDAAFILYNDASGSLSFYFICILIILSIINLLTNRIYFFGDFIIWFLVINLHNRIYPTLTGGNNLLNQFLFFNCFITARFLRNESWWSDLRTFLHNFGLLSIIVQICLVYFLAAMAKLQDPDWLSGKALTLITQTNHFSMFRFPHFGKGGHVLLMIVNYGVLFYQLLFPVFIWLKKLKKPLLLLGILMHLYIAFVMGIMGFGLIMIIPYVYFWPFEKLEGKPGN